MNAKKVGGLGGLATFLGKFERFNTATTPPSGGLAIMNHRMTLMSQIEGFKLHGPLLKEIGGWLDSAARSDDVSHRG